MDRTKVKKFIICIIEYLAWSGFIIIMSGLYEYATNIRGEHSYLYYINRAFRVFLNMDVETSVSGILIVECIIRDIFLMIYSALIVQVFLQPINPIHFSKYVVIDSDTNETVFRYRIKLPRG